MRRRMMESIKTDIQNRILCVLPREMNTKEILTEYPIPIDYDNCVVYLSQKGENVATQGKTTRWGYIFYVIDGRPKYMVSPYVNDLISANDISNNAGMAWNGSNFSYFSVIDGKITASTLTTQSSWFAEGNTLEYVCLPFNLFTGKWEG